MPVEFENVSITSKTESSTVYNMLNIYTCGMVLTDTLLTVKWPVCLICLHGWRDRNVNSCLSAECHSDSTHSPAVQRESGAACHSGRRELASQTVPQPRAADRTCLTFTAQYRQPGRVWKWTQKHRWLTRCHKSSGKLIELSDPRCVKTPTSSCAPQIQQRLYFLDWIRAFHVDNANVTLWNRPVR